MLGQDGDLAECKLGEDEMGEDAMGEDEMGRDGVERGEAPLLGRGAATAFL